MRPIASIVVVLLLYTLTASPSSAQATKDRAIEQYTCKDLMRESGASRDVAIRVFTRVFARKVGNNKIYIDTLHKQSDELIESDALRIRTKRQWMQ